MTTLAAFVAYTLSNRAKSGVPLDGPSGTALPTMPSYSLSTQVAYNLGAYAARYVVPGPISTEVPSGCTVSMINILQRHGARYPTEDAAGAIQSALSKARSAHNITDKSLKFVPRFSYPNMTEQLVPFGRNQSYISGRIIAAKYAALENSIFVRSAPLHRVFESSRWWRQGFEGGSFNVSIPSLPEPDLVILVANNTLNVTTCTAAEKLSPKPGHVKSQEWIAQFVPDITKHLNHHLHGANLDNEDTLSLMSLCGFDTAFRNGSASPWCGVFNATDFENYEYFVDLSEYYSNSYGSQYAPSEGVGWVNELISRLTGWPVYDHTSTDSTLDSSQSTFPYGPSAPKIFADFSSDNNIDKILSALGILRDNTELPPSGPIPTNRQFYVSRIVPFAGSTVVEKLNCSETSSRPAGDYVRILVNDAVVTQNSSYCHPWGTAEGLCPLGGFLNSQAFAVSGGNWTSCFSNNTQDAGAL
ncbi:histidine phosphatase family containing protein [Ceratobasidium sp. AG-Ba]|nr:histidine phosphatase family containing protein [Ceratobasidium sp. AG-Ba]